MKRECFTCSHKVSTELTKDERKKLKEELDSNGVKYIRIPEMIFHCKLSGMQINQTDDACDHYLGDKVMEDIRKDLSKIAMNLRKNL